MKYSQDIFTHYTNSVSSFVKAIYELFVVTVCSINSQHIASPNQLHKKHKIKKKCSPNFVVILRPVWHVPDKLRDLCCTHSMSGMRQFHAAASTFSIHSLNLKSVLPTYLQ